MKILLLCAHNFAGVITEIWKGINKYTEHTAKMITIHPHQYGYESEYWYKDLTSNQICDMISEANILHLNEFYAPPFLERFFIGKKILTHCHGFSFRANNELRKKLKESLEKRWFGKVLLSTPDLYKFIIPETDPNLYQYLPNPFPIDDPLYQPIERPLDTILVDHSPYNPEMKGTTFIVDAIGNLAIRGYKVKLKLNMGAMHRECLKIKQQCHISFDSLARESSTHALEAVGLGVNGIESLAQGKPVLVRITHAMPYYEELTREVNLKKVPLVLVEQNTLEDKLEDLLKNPEKIIQTGKEGREWALKTHGVDRVVQKLLKIYDGIESF